MLNIISQLETRMGAPTAKGLAQAVTRAIREGALQSGDRLPPVRQLAHELVLSPTTVNAAWAMLVRAGTIKTGGRRGTVVADLRTPREVRYRHTSSQEPPYAVDLSTGTPDPQLLPSLDRAIRIAGAAHTRCGYLEDPVHPGLRDYLLSTWPYNAKAITVVNGAMDALDLVIRSALRFGDRVVVENPTLRSLVDLIESTGMQIVGVPLDEQGMIPAELAAAVAEPVQAVFLQPRAHNPTGVSMTPARARALAKVLRGTDALVVEDESASAIATAPDVTLGRSLPHRTVHIRSFSKSHGPDLRLAAVSGPEDVIAGVRHLRQLGQGWSSWLLQGILFELLTDAKAAAQVEQARGEYARRQAMFASVLAEHGIPLLGRDGLNAWVPVRDEAAALMRLAAEGIGAAPGALFTVRPENDAHVRITVGLLGRNLEDVASRVARAAMSGGWGTHAR